MGSQSEFQEGQDQNMVCHKAQVSWSFDKAAVMQHIKGICKQSW